MKNISKILILMIVPSLSLLIGCGGGGGGGSDTPTKKGYITGKVVNSSLAPISGATVKLTPGNYTTTTDSNGKYTFNVPVGSYTITVTYGGETASTTCVVLENQTTTVTDLIPGEDTVTITVANPTVTYGDAVKLKYSSTAHLITVNTTLPAKYSGKALVYQWHLDSIDGTILQNTDGEYDSENYNFIYRPTSTSTIPADVTTGANRVYNRGFMQGNVYVEHYLYLVIKTEDNIVLGSKKFYVDTPTTPGPPSV